MEAPAGTPGRIAALGSTLDTPVPQRSSFDAVPTS
jgi:hypothetical protein